MTREAVYKAIDSERNHQDRKWGTPEKHPHEVGAWVTLIRKFVNDAEVAWSGSSNDYTALIEIRKVAAIAVACMEQHGVIQRDKFVEPPVESMRR